MADSLSSLLGITMYVGAARADATPEQLEELRSRLSPFIENRVVEGIIDVVNEVMGPDWKPSGPWRGFWSEEWTR